MRKNDAKQLSQLEQFDIIDYRYRGSSKNNHDTKVLKQLLSL